MHRQESRSEFGIIKIHKNVIASIASLAAAEIEGVKRVGSSRKNSILNFFNRNTLPEIKVDIDKNEEVRLDVPIVIIYDFNIPDVSNKVQDNIRSSLEKMTSLLIRDVNISVQGIERS